MFWILTPVFIFVNENMSNYSYFYFAIYFICVIMNLPVKLSKEQ